MLQLARITKHHTIDSCPHSSQATHAIGGWHSIAWWLLTAMAWLVGKVGLRGHLRGICAVCNFGEKMQPSTTTHTVEHRRQGAKWMDASLLCVPVSKTHDSTQLWTLADLKPTCQAMSGLPR
jgi:hypothetical protein